MGSIHHLKPASKTKNESSAKPSADLGKPGVTGFQKGALRFQIRHDISGRLRVVFPELKNRKYPLDRLVHDFSQIPGVERVLSNRYCGSVTVLYDPEQFQKSLFIGELKGLCEKELRETNPDTPKKRVHTPGTKRQPIKHGTGKPLLWTLGGTLFVGMSALGIIVPGLPTAPFVLLAAYCYVRGSERHYHWLLNHRIFGKFIEETPTGVRISRKAKKITVYLLWVSIFISCVFFVQSMLIRTFLVLMGLGVSIYMLRDPKDQIP